MRSNVNNLHLLYVNFFYINLIEIYKLIFYQTFSYNIRTNNIFIRLGIPAPPAVPFLGETINVMKKVS